MLVGGGTAFSGHRLALTFQKVLLQTAHGYLQTLPTIQTFFPLVCPLAVSRWSSIDDLYGTAPVLFFNSFFLSGDST